MKENELEIGGIYRCRLPQWRRARLARLLDLDTENQKALMRMIYGPYEQADLWVSPDQILAPGDLSTLDNEERRKGAIIVCAAVNLTIGEKLPELRQCPDGEDILITGIILAAALRAKQADPGMSNNELADKFRDIFNSCLGAINLRELDKAVQQQEG